MSFVNQVRCDSPHCDGHVETEDTEKHPPVPDNWLTLWRTGYYPLHFCSVDCLKNWAKPEHNPYVSKQLRKVGEP